MGRYGAFVLLAVASSVMIARSGSAQVQRIIVRQIDNGGQGELADTVSNDVAIDFLGELRGQQIVLELTQGSIFQHPQGTNLPPNASLLPAFPDLAFDTFLTMGGANSALSSPVINILGLEDPPPFGIDYINAKWAPATGIAIINQADFMTARITLSLDAQGTWRYFGSVSAGDAGRVFDDGVVVDGVMIVPEPTAAFLSLVGLAIVTMTFSRQGWLRAVL